MQLYTNNVQDRYGNALVGASVTIRTGAGDLATLYSDNGVTLASNPLKADSTGEFAFYAANGRYTFTVAAAGMQSEIVSAFELADALELQEAATGGAAVATTKAAEALASANAANDAKNTATAQAEIATDKAAQTAADRLQTGEDRNAARDSAANALTSEQIVVAAQLDITANWSDKLATAAVQAGIATTGGNVATEQAGISTAQAGLAATAKTEAEVARDIAWAAGLIYATPAAGITATTATTNKYFVVPDATAFLILYLNVAGAAVEQARWASTATSPVVVRYRADFVGTAIAKTVVINHDALHGNTGTVNVWDGRSLRYVGPLDFRVPQVFSAGEKGGLYSAYELASLQQDDAGATPITASGQTLGRVKDLSGNNYHMLQATAGSRPTYIEDGSLRVIRFNGTAAFLKAASVNLAGATKCTIMAAFKQRGTPAGGIMTHGAGGTTGLTLQENNGAANCVTVSAGNGATYQFDYSIYNNVTPTARMVTAIIDPAQAVATDRIKIFQNGLQSADVAGPAAGTITAAVFASRDLFLGAVNGASFFTNADLYDFLIIDRELTATERTLIEAIWMSRLYNTGAYQLNSFDDSAPLRDAFTHPQTSSFASVSFMTDATSVDVTGFVNGTFYTSFPGLTKIGVLIDGVYNQELSPGANGAFTKTAALPAGRKRVTLVNGPQSSAGNLSKLGTFMTSVAFNRVATRVVGSAVNRLGILGDSIAAGAHASPTHQLGWVMQLRAARTAGPTVLEADGSRSLYLDCADAFLRARLVAKLVAFNLSALYIALGTNDYQLNNWTAANFGIAYGALLDDLHAAAPGLVIFCQTPLLRSIETANGLGSTTGDYRAAIATVVSTRGSFTTLVDGTAITLVSDLMDGVHPNTAGHTKIFNYVKALPGIL